LDKRPIPMEIMDPSKYCDQKEAATYTENLLRQSDIPQKR
jgi:hypothetical protein